MRCLQIEEEIELKNTLTAVAIVPVLVLMGCASPSGELRKNLRAYGMGSSEAKCVSRELADQLETREIKSINRVLRAGRSDGTTRPSQVIVAVRELDDPRVIKSVAIANAGCLLLN